MSRLGVNTAVTNAGKIKSGDRGSLITLTLENIEGETVEVVEWVRAYDVEDITRYIDIPDYSVQDNQIFMTMPEMPRGEFNIEIKDDHGRIYPAEGLLKLSVLASTKDSVDVYYVTYKDLVLEEVEPMVEQYIIDNPDGFKGEQGIQGIQGETGEQGIQGERGLKGDTGEQGEQGIQGETGEQGIQGEAGYTPIKGVDYFDGEKGDKGDKGDTGERGEQGIQGIQGEKGDKGDKGDRGELGWRGEKGEKGDPGQQLGWQEPVDTESELPTEADENDTRMARDTGKVFRFNGSEWLEIQHINIDNFLSLSGIKIDEYNAHDADYTDYPVDEITVFPVGSSAGYPVSGTLTTVNLSDGNLYQELQQYEWHTKAIRYMTWQGEWSGWTATDGTVLKSVNEATPLTDYPYGESIKLAMSWSLGNGTLKTIRSTNMANFGRQLFFLSTNDNIYTRRELDGEWTDWKQIQMVV